MVSNQRAYHSYLLRLWEVDDEQGPAWRASLESPGTGERRGFASLGALFAFLAGETVGRPGDQPGPGRQAGTAVDW